MNPLRKTIDPSASSSLLRTFVGLCGVAVPAELRTIRPTRRYCDTQESRSRRLLAVHGPRTIPIVGQLPVTRIGLRC